MLAACLEIADAVGAEKILLVGYTPAPMDRMGRENTRITKTALGSEQSVLWQQYATAKDAFSAYPSYTPVVVEQTPTATRYTEYTPPVNSLYVFGNEIEGVSSAVRHTVPTHIHLPMHGVKESLNVTNAVAVILYHHLAYKRV